MKRLLAGVFLFGLLISQCFAAFFFSSAYLPPTNVRLGAEQTCNNLAIDSTNSSWGLLDANHIAFVFEGSDGTYLSLITINQETITCGPPKKVTGGGGLGQFQQHFADPSATEFVLAFPDSSNGNKFSVIACDLSVAPIACSSAVTPHNSVGAGRVVMAPLNSGLVVALFYDSTLNGGSGGAAAVACSVSGSATPTCGTPVALLSGIVASTTYGIGRLTDTTAFVAVGDTGAGSISHEVLTVSGTAISVGAAATVSAPVAVSDLFSVGVFDASHVIMNANGAYAASISGGVVTLGTPVAFSATVTGPWTVATLTPTTAVFITRSVWDLYGCSLTPPTTLSCTSPVSVPFDLGQSLVTINSLTLGTVPTIGKYALLIEAGDGRHMAIATYSQVGGLVLYPTTNVADYPAVTAGIIDASRIFVNSANAPLVSAIGFMPP